MPGWARVCLPASPSFQSMFGSGSQGVGRCSQGQKAAGPWVGNRPDGVAKGTRWSVQLLAPPLAQELAESTYREHFLCVASPGSQT